MYAWFFMRVSGILLLFLSIGHLCIMHIFHDVSQIDYDFVAGRWNNPLWRMYDGLMLILALVHGMNGLRMMLDDWLSLGYRRVIAMSILWTVFGVILFMGLLILFMFPVSEGL